MKGPHPAGRPAFSFHLTSDKVELVGERLPIRRLRSVLFRIEGREQNAEKPSRWGRSRRGAVHKFIAVAVDGQVKEYGAMAKRKAIRLLSVGRSAVSSSLK